MDPPLYESVSKYQAVLVFLILSAPSACSCFLLTVDLLIFQLLPQPQQILSARGLLVVCSCRARPPLELVAVPAFLEDTFSTVAGKHLEMFPEKQLVLILGSKPPLDQRRQRG